MKLAVFGVKSHVCTHLFSGTCIIGQVLIAGFSPISQSLIVGDILASWTKSVFFSFLAKYLT